MFNSYKPDDKGLADLQRFFELTGPSFLDIDRAQWPRLIGLSHDGFFQLFEDLVMFGAVEVPKQLGVVVGVLERVFDLFCRDVPDYPGLRYMDILAGSPPGLTIPSEAARLGAIFTYEGKPFSLLGFLSTVTPLLAGEPFRPERVSALGQILWYVEIHLANRAEFVDRNDLGRMSKEGSRNG